MKKIFLLPFLLVLISFTISSDKQAYRIYDPKGKLSSYDKMLAEAKSADVVLFGELHDNPVCHWLQLELTKDLLALKKKDLVLGAEMFEADDQIVLNEYLKGKISEKTFREEVKLWPNYKTDYKPLVELAKSNGLVFVAANIPRRYANMVYSKGIEKLDSIDADARKWICPLPMKYDASLKGYKEIYESAGGHGGENLPKSQAVKDATMAHFILKNWEKGKLFVHYNGTYHSNFHEGIEWYLKQVRPDLKIMTIGTTEQADIDTLSGKAADMADYIICIPETMSKSH